MSRPRPNYNLKVATRWIGPDGIERKGMLVESMRPRIISLVLDVFNGICGTSSNGVTAELESATAVIPSPLLAVYC